jgi:hypothetical protein
MWGDDLINLSSPLPPGSGPKNVELADVPQQDFSFPVVQLSAPPFVQQPRSLLDDILGDMDQPYAR